MSLGPLTVVTGGNGSGKSNLYRALRLLKEAALGRATWSLAREGGLSSVLWAGPEQLAAAVRRGERKVQGTARKKPISVCVGFSGDDLSYSIEFGLPANTLPTAFSSDAEIKREVIWTGDLWQPSAALVDRRFAVARARDDRGAWETISTAVPPQESVLTVVADPRRAPAAVLLREELRSWRFYDVFRSDPDAPARQVQIGTWTPVLNDDGSDLAAALQTIRESDGTALDTAIEDAFPGARLKVTVEGGNRFGLELEQDGLLRPLSQVELSDGTLRYLLWMAVLLTRRPPGLMILNEPETSLHPDLFPALGRLIRKASERGQVWVVTHSPLIRDLLARTPRTRSIVLEKELGETAIAGQSLVSGPAWSWPRR